MRLGVTTGFSVAWVLALAPACLVSVSQGSDEIHGMSVADTIQTSRLQGGSAYSLDSAPYQISPDGRHYLTIVAKGDLERNGLQTELWVGGLADLASARTPHVAAKLFTPALYAHDDIFHTAIVIPGWSPTRWTDDRHISLFWEDPAGVIQAYLLDVGSGTLRQLTSSKTDLNVFALGFAPDGTVLYSAYAPPADQAIASTLLRDGFAVENDDAYSLIEGHINGPSALARAWDEDWFLQAPGRAPVRVTLGTSDHVPSQTFIAIFSPDSRYAVLDGVPQSVPASWLEYKHSWIRQQVTQWRTVSPYAFNARSLHQLYLLDVATLKARPLIDAPALDYNNKNVAWSPDGTSIIVGPTFEPADKAGPAGLAGHAVLEIDRKTLQWTRLPINLDPKEVSERSIRWITSGVVSIGARDKQHILRKAKRGWKVAADLPAPNPIVRLALSEDLNAPSALVAIDVATGQKVRVLDPNEGLLKKFLLGHVEVVHWKGPDGFEWTALLYYPVGYSPNRRYPLAVQTHGVDSTKAFSVYGEGGETGPGFGPYAAQTLASRGIAVLQVDDRPVDNPAEEASVYTRGYEAGIQALVDRGLVDPRRVAIEGFSRTGWYVDYALTHPSFKYAAALAADHISASYVESTLAQPGTAEPENGGPPFGAGLKTWLESAPGFNVENVHVPLMIQQYSGPLVHILSDWEMYSRLRRLNRPVELYVIPDIEHGGHNLQNPRQVRAAKETAVDWFDFWLNGHEDPDASKEEQYRRWEKLCDQQKAANQDQPTYCVATKH